MFDKVTACIEHRQRLTGHNLCLDRRQERCQLHIVGGCELRIPQRFVGGDFRCVIIRRQRPRLEKKCETAG